LRSLRSLREILFRKAQKNQEYSNDIFCIYTKHKNKLKVFIKDKSHFFVFQPRDAKALLLIQETKFSEKNFRFITICNYCNFIQ